MTLDLTLQGQAPRLRWHDDGVGIAADMLPHVCEPFFTTQLGRTGVGLGLTSVYALVTDHMKGALQIESVPGQGSTFTIQLPLAQGEDALPGL
ncbi:MAG: HAMP domain-containing sensor histidine kinase [Inhella sp.]